MSSEDQAVGAAECEMSVCLRAPVGSANWALSMRTLVYFHWESISEGMTLAH